LEFEHVILIDRLKGDVPDRSMLLYDYDKSLHIKNIYFKMSKRENFDDSYKIILEKHKKLSAKDKMNVLYVALTRAVESMIVIRKPKKSIFDALSMIPMSVGVLTKHKREKSSLNSLDNIEECLITDYGTRKVVQPQEEEGDSDAIIFGTALHYTLEMMPSFSVMTLAETINQTQNRYGAELTPRQFEDIKNRIVSLIAHDRFKKLLIGAKISKEQSLSFEGEFKQIDLLLEYEKTCMVLDYKSSKKYGLKHQSQVRYYKKAIYNITGKYTRGIIVYLLEDGVELVEV
jgi:exodeoxyribonuclease V beta subunit